MDMRPSATKTEPRLWKSLPREAGCQSKWRYRTVIGDEPVAFQTARRARLAGSRSIRADVRGCERASDDRRGREFIRAHVLRPRPRLPVQVNDDFRVRSHRSVDGRAG